MKSLSIILIWSALLLCLNGAAQVPQGKEKESIELCNGLLARQTVEQLAVEARGIEEPDKRIEVLIRVADYLWVQDEPSARGHLTEAFRIAENSFSEIGEERSARNKSRSRKPDYRFKVVIAISKYDPEWARELSDRILKDFDENQEKKDPGGSNDALRESESEKILNVAVANAKNNPELALALARRVMRYPLTASWYFSLYLIADENQRLADTIYAELLSVNRNAEVHRLLFLSAYPFKREKIFGVEKHLLGMSVPKDVSPNSQFKSQFVNTFVRRVLSLTPEDTSRISLLTHTPEPAIAYFAAIEIEPIVASQFPHLLQAVSRARMHASSIISDEVMNQATKRDDLGNTLNRSFEAKLREVEDADREGRLTDRDIVNLITSAKAEKEFTAAEKWLERIREDRAREGAENYFYFQWSKLATSEHRFSDAGRYADRVSTIQHRAVSLLAIADARLRDPASRQEMAAVLLEVDKAANKAPTSLQKAQVYFALASQYAKFDEYSAYVALSDAIKSANKLDRPNLLATSLSQEIVGNQFQHSVLYEVPGFDINKLFYQIGRKDFQGALAHAGSFSDKYYAALATLAVVRDCREKKETKRRRTNSR